MHAVKATLLLCFIRLCHILPGQDKGMSKEYLCQKITLFVQHISSTWVQLHEKMCEPAVFGQYLTIATPEWLLILQIGTKFLAFNQTKAIMVEY